MGREELCKCRWAGDEGDVKVLLESGEIIVRGDLRKRIRLDDISDLAASHEGLHFRVGSEAVLLSMGRKAAASWAKAIVAPPPTLAKKLSISGSSLLQVIGEIDDRALEEAVAEAQSPQLARGLAKHTGAKSNAGARLILVRIDTMESLHAALHKTRSQLERGTPIWIIYPKGKGHEVSEASVRSLLRDTGMIDTKVVSVSARLTALRFIWRKRLDTGRAVDCVQ